MNFDGGFSSLSYFNPKNQDQQLCGKLGVAPCDLTTMSLQGSLILATCESQAQENCVESMSITQDGTTYQGEFVSYSPGPQVQAQPEFGLPQGATVGQWKVPGLNHQGGSDNYAVHARLDPSMLFRNSVSFQGFSAQVTPFNQISGSYETPSIAQQRDDTRSYVASMGSTPECVWTGPSQCGRAQDFAEGSVVNLTVRISNKIGGWFNGRLKAPEIAIAKHSATSNRVSVSAEPAAVSRLGFNVPRSQATKDLLDFFKDSNENVTGRSTTANGYAFDYVEASREQLKDTASGETMTWAIATTSSNGNSCMRDTSRVLGIVTTNSMAYQSDAPMFSRGALQYKVSGLHLQPGGEEPVLGTYDLVMRSDVARCLYRFSKAPISATISVTGEGDKNIATTVVGEKNGWLKLAAYGFTFSNKTINVKLTQKKQTTITCVAPGKKSKKVTAVKPKCPKGYKKR